MEELIRDISKLSVPSEPILVLDENKLGFDPEGTAEFDDAKEKLIKTLEERKDLLSVSAPQLGINKRIFAIRFNDKIKIFLNPLVTNISSDKIVNFEPYLDTDKFVYICRPKEIKIIYYNEDLKYEDNQLLNEVACEFMRQYNLLDGIIPGEIFNYDFEQEKVTPEVIPMLIDATYSGGGFIFEKSEVEENSLEEVSEALSKMCEIYTSIVDKFADSEDSGIEETTRLILRRFKLDERVKLGLTSYVDIEGYQRAKAAKRQEIMTKRAYRAKSFNDFVGKKSRRH